MNGNNQQSPSEHARLPFPPQAGLPELLELAEAKYRTRFETIGIGGLEVDVLQLADLEEHIDRLAETAGEGGLELPFWAKIWPTSILLSYFILKLPTALNGTALEIGSGVGLCGLIAAKHGFPVLISDNHPDALLFARINILRNGLQERADVARIDFTQDVLDTRYPLILGSEVVYREGDVQPLIQFLEQHLDTTPSSQALLARSYKRQADTFYRQAEKRFSIQEKTLGYKESTASDVASERHLCIISKLTRRPA